MALTEKQRKVRNVNKGNNLIGQADHNRASSNINSISNIKRYEKAEHRFCKWLGENTEPKKRIGKICLSVYRELL